MADNVAAVEDDLSLPRAAVNKMIKEMIPMIRVSNDARELVLNCCTEFIHLIASEANEICNKQTKKTISPEHVIQALESLGFHDYVKDVEGVYQQFKKQAQTRKKNNKMKNQGVSEEELLRQQQALIAKARAEQAQEEWMHMQQHHLSLAQQQPMNAAQQQQLVGAQPPQLGVPPQQMSTAQEMTVAPLSLQPGPGTPVPLASPKDAPVSSPMTGNANFPVPNIAGSIPGPNALLHSVTTTSNVERVDGVEHNIPVQDNTANGIASSNQTMETEEKNTHTSIEVIASSADMTQTPMEVKEDVPCNLENT